MPVCALKRVARKVNVYFSYIHSIVVNVSNFNCNQFFNLPVIIELKGTVMQVISQQVYVQFNTIRKHLHVCIHKCCSF